MSLKCTLARSWAVLLTSVDNEITVNIFYIIFIDIDECASTPCDFNAVCANTDGNFTCTCHIGYSGDGFNCAGKILSYLQTVSNHCCYVCIRKFRGNDFVIYNCIAQKHFIPIKLQILRYKHIFFYSRYWRMSQLALSP